MGTASNYQDSYSLEVGELFDVPNLTGTPERNLLLAMLERAILDFVGNETEEASDAERWIFESDQNSNNFKQPPFSFAWVCEQLDLDVGKVASTIVAMPKRGSKRIAPWYFMKHEKACA